MSYTPVGWKDYPEKTTPTSAANLNKMEQGIINNDAAITELQEEVASQNETLTKQISELNNALNSIDNTFSIMHVVEDKLDYIKNGKERILVCAGCTLADINAVDISDSLPVAIVSNYVYVQYNSGLVNGRVWYDKAKNAFAGNYRESYGNSSAPSIKSTSIIHCEIRWFVA